MQVLYGTVNNSTVLDSNYSWSFKFISGVTTVKTNGMTNYTADHKISGGHEVSKNDYYSARLTSNSQKGNVWVRYNNVGTYNGQIIDLQITLTGWSALGTANKSAGSDIGGVNYPAVFFGKNKIGITISSPPTVVQPVFTCTFYKHSTNTTISIKCHETFKDIDNGEYLVPVSGINTMYKYSNSVLTLTTAKASCPLNKYSNDEDKTNWITCLISGSSFKFRYTRSQDESASGSSSYRDSFGFSCYSESLAPFRIY